MNDDDFNFVMRGVEYNLELAKHGLTFADGLAVGKTLKDLTNKGLLTNDMMLEARILTSSAADARMSGVKMPAIVPSSNDLPQPLGPRITR